MALLSDLVCLFRASGKPSISDSETFKVESIQFTVEIEQALTSIFEAPAAKELDVVVTIGALTITRDADYSALKRKIGSVLDVLSVQLPRRGANQFYHTFDDFISRVKSINIGDIPDSFYVVDLDYLHRGTESHKRPLEVDRLEHFCEFIRLIKKSCHFVETNFDSSYKAVFVVSEEKASEMIPRTVELSFPSELLESDMINLELLKEIVNSTGSETHREEKLSTFRLSLWETISESKSTEPDVLYLARHWDDLLNRYNATYSLYIRGFSFNKFKIEIQEFVHSSILKAHNLLGDIVLKTLSIPPIFAIWLYLTRSPKYDEIFSLGLCFAVLFSSLIVIFAIDNQQFLVRQLKISIKNTLGQFSKTKNSIEKLDNEEVEKLIFDSGVTIERRLKNIGNRLLAMRISVWLFVIVSVIVTSYLGWPYDVSFALILTLLSAFVALTAIVAVASKVLKTRAQNC